MSSRPFTYRAGRIAAFVAGAVTAAALAAGSSAATAAKLPATGAAAGYSGKAARIYTLYYEHCKHYTHAALAWPRKARSATAAARMYAGPPRTFQTPAFRGCLAGLGAGEATITVAKLVALAAEHDEDM